jgi:chaperonin GroES
LSDFQTPPFLNAGVRQLFTKILFDMSEVHFKPINDRVVVKPLPAEDKTAGGIIIPDTAKEKPQQGEIVAVGPGKEGIKPTVNVGDRVLYGKYAGQELKYAEHEYLIMREDDILVVLN